MFNHHNKPPSESAEEYITALYQLVETCEYGELKEEMLRDRIVVGMRDAALSECLQTDAKLMLDKVKRELCKTKAVRQQQLQLQAEPNARQEALEAVRATPDTTGKSPGGGNVLHKDKLKPAPPPAPNHRHCVQGAGGPTTPLEPGAQPAQMCTTSAIGKVTIKLSVFLKPAATEEPVNTLTTDSAFLGAVSNGTTFPWFVSIKVRDREMTFKMDTEAR